MSSFNLIVGTVRSGKTSFLRSNELRDKSFVALNTNYIDDMYDYNEFLQSETGFIYIHPKIYLDQTENITDKIKSIPVDNLTQVYDLIISHNKLYNILLIDEIQLFFHQDTVKHLLDLKNNYCNEIYAAGLITDFLHRPFKHMIELLLHADYIHWKKRICEYCKNIATSNLRITDNIELVVVEKSIYKPVCAGCYNAKRI